MLRAMADGGLQSFVTNSGGADGFFFNGPKETKQISSHLKFGSNQYKFALEPTVSSEMMIREEATLYTSGQWPSDWHVYSGGVKESRLPEWKDRKSSWNSKYLSAEAHVYNAVSSWMVYHVHDTSSTAPMRRDGSARDFRELRSDAGNIAAFLMKMREDNGARYQDRKSVV